MTRSTDAENLRVDSLLGEARPPLGTDALGGDLRSIRARWQELEPVPVLLASRDEGVDRSWSTLDVRTLLTGEQSAGRYSAHSVQLAPGAGLDPHYFVDTSSYVLVTDGSVRLQVGETVEDVGPHSLAFTPPATRTGFRNTSDSPATVIILYTPAGVDAAFGALHQQSPANDGDDAACREILSDHGFHFDDAALSNDALTNATLPDLDFEFRGHGDLERLRKAFVERPAVPRIVATTADEFDAAAAGASRRKELIGGHDTAGQAMLNMLSGLVGFGAPAHHQPTEDEFFFITEGELQMTCATAGALLRPGAMAFCPRNCTHAFENLGPAESRFVTLNAPAGHERAMAAVRAAAAAGATKEDLWDLSVAGGFVFHSVEALG